MRKKKKKMKYVIVGTMLIFICGIGIAVFFYRESKVSPQEDSKVEEFTAEKLEIQVVTSEKDKDKDDVDDYTDIMLGAREYINTKPEYKSEYYAGGYPNDGCGVCTDVIWNAFKAAGYDLKELVDKDISNHLDCYEDIETPDPNIDFRRVTNLNIFFKRNAENLSTDFSNPEEWQAGDIVVFTKHIAICSDKRNEKGIPFIIHHDIQGAREVNEMENYKIVGHYRWKG